MCFYDIFCYRPWAVTKKYLISWQPFRICSVFFYTPCIDMFDVTVVILNELYYIAINKLFIAQKKFVAVSTFR